MSASIVAGFIVPNKKHNEIFTETTSTLKEFNRKWPNGVFLCCEKGTWVQIMNYKGRLFFEWGEGAA